MADSSFDIVNNIDRQEVDNALNQARKELATRFDFKGSTATIEWNEISGSSMTTSMRFTLISASNWSRM